MLFFKTKIFFFFQLFALKLPKNQKKPQKTPFLGLNFFRLVCFLPPGANKITSLWAKSIITKNLSRF